MKVVVLPTNYSKVVVKFVKKNIFTRFGKSRAIISDGGSNFVNNWFRYLLAKYRIRHKLAIAYHPQISGQVEISNHKVK